MKHFKRNQFPTIIDLDQIKSLMPGYDPQFSDQFHEESAKIANKIFDNKLKQIEAEEVLLMCGGSASGKSEFLAKFLPEDFSGIVFDSTFSTLEGAKNKIRTIQKSKNTPILCLILPDSLARSFTVFCNRDRKIPEYRFYETHSGARKVALWIAENYPALELNIYANRYEPNNLEEEQLVYLQYKFANHQNLLSFLRSIQYTEAEIYDLILQGK